MFKRILSGFLAALLILEPFAASRMVYQGIALTLPYAIPALTIGTLFKSVEAEAQPVGVATGKATGATELGKISANLPSIDGSNNVLLPSAGTSTNQAGLVQHRGEVVNENGSIAATMGNSSAYDNIVNNVTTRVATEDSNQGNAYRTMLDSRHRRADLTEAGFLDNSKTIMSTPFTGCTQTSTTVPTSTNYNITDEKKCTRVVNTAQSCHVERLYDFKTPAVIGDVQVVSNMEEKTNYWSPYGGGWHTIDKAVSVDWSKVNKVQVEGMYCDDECEVQYKDANAGGGFIPIPPTRSAGFSYGGCGERGGNINVPTTDITPYVQGIENLIIRLLTCTVDGGRGYMDVHWYTNSGIYEDRGLQQTPPGCWTLQYNNSFCHADSWTCSDSATKYSSGTAISPTIARQGGMVSIWADNTPYENTAFEQTNVCWKADGVGLCNFNQGPMSCFTDAHGNTVCPTNDGSVAQDTCQALEDDGCVWVKDECIQGAQDTTTGACMAYTSTYSCGGQTVSIPGQSTTTVAVNCGATRCMGSECTTVLQEHNNSFGLVNSLVGNIGAMGQDGGCDGGDCKLFTGKPLRCKVALGGLFDCCGVNVPGVNWMSYFQLGYQGYKAAQQQGIIGEMPSLAGVGKQLGNAVVQTIDSLAGTDFTSAWDGFTAGSSSGAGGLTSTVAELQQELTNQVAQWVTDNFSSDMAQALFTESAPGSGVFSMSAGAQSVMNAVSTAFFYIYVAYLILSIIFACTNDEFELAANKQMRSCHYIGSYCSGSTLGMCWEKKESYCCFGSALSRIMQEQIRKQMLGWGTPENPSCDGLTTGQMAQVNWDNVDLSEYAAMMVATGIKPSAGQEGEYYKMENLTKANFGGATLNTSRGNGSSGVNAVQALQNSTQSTSSTGINMDPTRSNAVQTGTSGWPVGP